MSLTRPRFSTIEWLAWKAGRQERASGHNLNCNAKRNILHSKVRYLGSREVLDEVYSHPPNDLHSIPWELEVNKKSSRPRDRGCRLVNYPSFDKTAQVVSSNCIR
jgi:hypothetical protein